MALRWMVRPNAYHDSVRLMRVSEALADLPGVTRAAAVMATPLNIDLLRADSLLPPDLNASPDDLLVAVLGEDEALADAALRETDRLLQARPVGPDQDGTEHPAHTLEEALRERACNLAVIAVPGQYAATEAYRALRAGLHVFLFSDNVSIGDEIALKTLAAERNLLMMGPDCGTAIIDGVGLGFANRVRPGPVGIVGASGTGIQQVCALLDSWGIGVAQAIGTGGRDLSSTVDGAMTRRALRALGRDEQVEIIALISKPADAEVARRLHRDLVSLAKPIVVCLLGETMADEGAVHYTPNLTEAAHAVARLLGVEQEFSPPSIDGEAGRHGGRVYGLYAGGTLKSEAAQVLDALDVRHQLLDLGDDEYTRGRAHPLIDPRLRASMLGDVAERPDVGAVLFDVILGDLAHPDPAGSLLEPLEQMQRNVGPPIVAALIGTEQDPQGLEHQRALLEAAGVHVYSSNVDAARAAGALVRRAA